MADHDLQAEFAEATDALYGLDPGDFVAARNELARRLRKGGNRDLASRVAELRRPSPAAWAVNQLARRHGPELDRLVRLGEALRAAQTQTLAGADAVALREAGRARRDAVARLTNTAVGLLDQRGAGAGAHFPEIAATLEAASLDPEAAVRASSGRLTSSLEPSSGFGDAGLALAVSTSERQHHEPTGTKPTGAIDVLADARRAAADARRLADNLAVKARDLETLAARRHRHVDEAEAEVARVQHALDEARRRADGVDRELEEVNRAAALAEAAAAEDAEHLRQAEQRAEGEA